MAIKKVIPDPLGTGGASQTQNDDGLVETIYQRSVTVITTDPKDGQVTVLAGCGVSIGDPYTSGREGDSGSVCRKRLPHRDRENPRVWRVDLEYGPLPLPTGGTGSPGEGEDPQYPVLEIRVGAFAKMKVCSEDIFGGYVVASNGLPYEPLPEIEVPGISVFVRRYEPNAAKVGIAKYVKAINKDPFMGQPAYKCMLYDARASRRILDQAIVYWEAEYELQFDRDGYLVELLDAHYYVKHGQFGSSNQETNLPAGTAVNKSVERITDRMGNPITTRVPLNGQGGVAQLGNKPTFRYLTYHLRPEEDFAALKMPQLQIDL